MALSEVFGIVLSVLPCVGRLGPWYRDRSRRKSWRQVMRAMRDLHEQMAADPFRPDIVVGVGRTGALVASLFSFNWRFRFCFLERAFVGRHGVVSARVVDTVGTVALDGKRALIVDAETITGSSLGKAKQFLLDEKGALEVRTMVLAACEGSAFEPDYKAFSYANPRRRPCWPWEYSAFVKRLRREAEATGKHVIWYMSDEVDPA